VPDFRVADWKTGLRFAFEAGPRLCYELNGHPSTAIRLPRVAEV
jgi:hypothetical protein